MSNFLDLKNITDDFLIFLHGLYGYHNDSLQGFGLYSNFLAQRGCPGIIIAKGRPDEPSATILHAAPIDEIISRNLPMGANVKLLREHIIIMIATYWEASIRKKIASCFNEKPNDVKSDIMADINHIRNDLLHNKGKSDQSAKNKIIKFEKGSTILFEDRMLEDIIEQIFKYINELCKQKFGENCYTNNSLNQDAIQRHLSQKHTVIKAK